jgi:hypothetical protein
MRIRGLQRRRATGLVCFVIRRGHPFMSLNAPGVDKLGISMLRRWRTRTAPLVITPRIVSYQQQDDVAADLVGQAAAKTQQQSVNVLPIALCPTDRLSEAAVPLPESFLVA